MPKAEYRSAVRSRRLINAALAELLTEKPLDKITVTDVVRRADINRGTFYAHYADIPDVIQHLIRQSFQQLRQVLDEQTGDPMKLPGVIVRQIQKMLESDPDFIRAVMESGAGPMFQEQLCNLCLEYLLSRKPMLTDISPEDFVLRLRFCAGGLGNLYRDWFVGLIPLTLDQLTEKAEEILLQNM